MTFTLAGLVALAFASRYAFILASVARLGIGSSIYHPEAHAHGAYVSGGRQGLAQGLFQVGGYLGGALAPLWPRSSCVAPASGAWPGSRSWPCSRWGSSRGRPAPAAIRNRVTAARASLSMTAASPSHSPTTIAMGLTV